MIRIRKIKTGKKFQFLKVIEINELLNTFV